MLRMTAQLVPSTIKTIIITAVSVTTKIGQMAVVAIVADDWDGAKMR